jgi:hypothetical protein
MVNESETPYFYIAGIASDGTMPIYKFYFDEQDKWQEIVEESRLSDYVKRNFDKVVEQYAEAIAAYNNTSS